MTLLPHQSRTVTFTITGHELSYFNVNANGWTLPDGRFSLYVGDSSALTSLPLRGKLKVTRTIGARYAALTAPATVDPGATFTARAKFVNHGNVPITDGIVQLGVPLQLEGRPTRAYASALTTAGQEHDTQLPCDRSRASGGRGQEPDGAAFLGRGRRRWRPERNGHDLGARPDHGDLELAGHRRLRRFRLPRQVVVTSHMNRAVVVHLSPSLPSGVTFAPASPAVRVPANHTVNLTFSVSVAAGQTPATDPVSLVPSFTYDGKSYPLAAAELTVDIPYASLPAAYDTTAISDDSNIAAANFDGNGNSYSEQALTAAGLAPGATPTVDGTTLQWPAVPAGTPDSVLAAGQTISLAGSSADTQLVVLGASSGADETGTGTIEYTDGTIQPYTLTLDNWFNNPDSSSNTLFATAAYINDSTGSGNHGVVGQRQHKAHVFAVAIPLLAGKTVSSVTLPTVATLPGVYPMHVFALGLGTAPVS